MLVIEDNFKTHFDQETFIALGGFDGLHLGHRALIQKTLDKSNENNCKSMILTFKNHPLTVINSDSAPKLIMDNATKLEILREMSIDIVNLINFDKEFMALSPREFVQKLCSNYNARGIIVGFNFRFGYKNLGDVDLLEKLSKEFGFTLYVIPPIKLGTDIISSTRIRSLISDEGNMTKVSKILKAPYTLAGKIIKGKQIGREIGFPTINLDYDKDFILPRGGVYYTLVEHQGSIFKGMTNVGYNPTVDNHKLSVETHIIDFNKNLYEENIKLYFITRVRDERKFDSLEELKNQLKKDKIFIKKQKLSINLK